MSPYRTDGDPKEGQRKVNRIKAVVCLLKGHELAVLRRDRVTSAQVYRINGKGAGYGMLDSHGRQTVETRQQVCQRCHVRAVTTQTTHEVPGLGRPVVESPTVKVMW